MKEKHKSLFVRNENSLYRHLETGYSVVHFTDHKILGR